jgi:hypothetical protein
VTKLAAELRSAACRCRSRRCARTASEELLDELAQTRITGLTFAPEAGTQRMRDVVNKNVTEEHIEESTRGGVRARLAPHQAVLHDRPADRGDDDVRGIVETGLRMLQIGRRELGARAEVTVSVSSHVPKPHTPFQWCAQDPHAEIERKQWLLRDTARRKRSLRLKHHHSGISWVEGLLARGDRRLADVIEAVWRAGARFDGWDEVLRARALAAGHRRPPGSSPRATSARGRWRRACRGTTSTWASRTASCSASTARRWPAGPARRAARSLRQLVHHANLVDASADARRLVCYDCGVACDLTKMRDDRLVALRTLGAEAPRARRGGALPIVDDRTMLDVAERGGGSPAEAPSPIDDAPRPTPRQREQARAERVRLNGHKGADAPYATYRIHFAKVGRAAFLGHLDLGRLLARVFRRADLALAMSRGFSPKPRISFGPALGLGVPSLGEVIDVDLEHAPQVGGRFVRSFSAPDDAPRAEVPAAEVEARLRCVCPEGVVIAGVELLPPGSPGLGRVIAAVDLLVRPAPDGIMFDGARVQRLADRFLSAERVVVQRPGKHGTREAGREIDVRALVQALEVVQGDAARALCEALDWPASAALLRARVKATAEGSVRPVELARALGVWGADDPRAEHALLARAAVVISPPEVAPTLAPLPPADAGVGDVASA